MILCLARMKTTLNEGKDIRQQEDATDRPQPIRKIILSCLRIFVLYLTTLKRFKSFSPPSPLDPRKTRSTYVSMTCCFLPPHPSNLLSSPKCAIQGRISFSNYVNIFRHSGEEILFITGECMGIHDLRGERLPPRCLILPKSDM